MKCRDIIRILEKLAPREYACDWDNPGLLAGRGDREVETVLTAVDATDEAVSYTHLPRGGPLPAFLRSSRDRGD